MPKLVISLENTIAVHLIIPISSNFKKLVKNKNSYIIVVLTL